MASKKDIVPQLFLPAALYSWPTVSQMISSLSCQDICVRRQAKVAMLTFELLKKSAGVVLFNDYLSLQRMHAIVHDVNHRSSIIRDKDGFFLGLAYDFRKAFEGQRHKSNTSKRSEQGPRFGVEFLWPVLLVQCRQLR